MPEHTPWETLLLGLCFCINGIIILSQFPRCSTDSGSYWVLQNQVHHRLATPLGDPQTAPTPSSMGADQLLTLAAQLQTHNSSGAQPGSVGYHLDPNAFSLPGVPCALTDPVPHAHSEKDHAHSDAVVDSATQHVRGVPQSQGPDGNVPDIQPRMQALLAGLQVVLVFMQQQHSHAATQLISFCVHCDGDMQTRPAAVVLLAAAAQHRALGMSDISL